THLHVLCSMPGPHYKNNRKLEKSKGQKLCFITTLMPFEERHMYNNEGDRDADEWMKKSGQRILSLPGKIYQDLLCSFLRII
ncbi:MAG: hypothetical protein PUF16_04315, partial [Lachnospiraceae bacterium]|nr:hypothetical protein [Lachnospiraceae bacterium]